MNKLLSGLDLKLLASIFVLLLFSVFIIGSLTPASLLQQIVYVILGLLLFFIFSQLDYRIYERFTWFLYGTSIIGLVFTVLAGGLTRGAVRWIQVGSFTIQPSELVKPFLIVFFAWFFSRDDSLNFGKIATGALLMLLPVFLIFIQPDLGSGLIVAITWLGIVWSSGITLRFVFTGLFFSAIFLPVFWQILRDYQKERIYTFINPLADPLHAGYNVIQSIIAVGSGQLLGRGLGRGTQSHLRFLPERHTDFIFASFAEEMGFLGSLILLILFFILGWQILNIAQKTQDKFGFLILCGVFTMLFGQIFINIGMNLGLLPVTGITLPLVSSGGSSLMAVMISLGIVENIAGHIKKKEVKYWSQ